MKNWIEFIVRFCYYGYYGAKYTRDYDADGIHSLIYAHIKRVRAFMESEDTHSVWNSSGDTRGMRQLREFEELSRRYHENELESYYFMVKCKNAKLSTDSNFREDMARAIEKDRKVSEGLKERYWYLLNNKVSGFWD